MDLTLSLKVKKNVIVYEQFFLTTKSLNIELNQTGYLLVNTCFFLQLVSIIFNSKL